MAKPDTFRGNIQIPKYGASAFYAVYALVVGFWQALAPGHRYDCHFFAFKNLHDLIPLGLAPDCYCFSTADADSRLRDPRIVGRAALAHFSDSCPDAIAAFRSLQERDPRFQGRELVVACRSIGAVAGPTPPRPMVEDAVAAQWLASASKPTEFHGYVGTPLALDPSTLPETIRSPRRLLAFHVGRRGLKNITFVGEATTTPRAAAEILLTSADPDIANRRDAITLDAVRFGAQIVWGYEGPPLRAVEPDLAVEVADLRARLARMEANPGAS